MHTDPGDVCKLIPARDSQSVRIFKYPQMQSPSQQWTEWVGCDIGNDRFICLFRVGRAKAWTGINEELGISWLTWMKYGNSFLYRGATPTHIYSLHSAHGEPNWKSHFNPLVTANAHKNLMAINVRVDKFIINHGIGLRNKSIYISYLSSQ